MRIKTKELVPGMVLGRDLVDSGFMVLRKGSALTGAIIATIRKRGIAHVDIEDDGAFSVPPQGQSVFERASAEYELFVQKKQTLEKLFADIDPDDGQMQLLKYCIMGQLEEGFDNDQR